MGSRRPSAASTARTAAAGRTAAAEGQRRPRRLTAAEAFLKALLKVETIVESWDTTATSGGPTTGATAEGQGQGQAEGEGAARAEGEGAARGEALASD